MSQFGLFPHNFYSNKTLLQIKTKRDANQFDL